MVDGGEEQPEFLATQEDEADGPDEQDVVPVGKPDKEDDT